MSSSSPKHDFLREETNELDSLDETVVVKRDQYKPNETAIRVHQSMSKIRIMRGGLGSGKTRCGTEHINALCLNYPGAFCFVGRKDITSLKLTTQKEFLENVVPKEAVRGFNVNDNILYYKNGSQIKFGETKDPDKILSTQLTAWMLDEANENDTREIVDKLEPRLRQPIFINGEKVTVPYAGLLVFNPTSKYHWLYELSKEPMVEDFQFSTYENRQNLPDNYIEDLERRLPPWERDRLLRGEWGIEVRGKPVYYGFNEKTHVRVLKPLPGIPIIRTWDFGYTHPCAKLNQFDPITGRYLVFREMLGDREKLNTFAPKVIQMTRQLVGASYPVIDFGDPHGADEKDLGVSSIEYLRIHHKIHVNYQRQRIQTGIEEIQELITDKAPFESDEMLPKFLVDPSCKITIAAYTYGYHQDEFGKPVKDGHFDHVTDVDRYGVIQNRYQALQRKRLTKKYVPKNLYTGY